MQIPRYSRHKTASFEPFPIVGFVSFVGLGLIGLIGPMVLLVCG